MTMMQKVQAKRSKKGFTLVELVIVIAILAILAAIAIPVITTTINSSKISVFESDTATMNMLIKEAINTSKASITTTTYNGKTAAEADVADLCKENNLGQSGTYTVGGAVGSNFFNRSIGGQTYTMVYSDHNVLVSGGGKTVTGDTIDGSKKISSFEAN